MKECRVTGIDKYYVGVYLEGNVEIEKNGVETRQV